MKCEKCQKELPTLGGKWTVRFPFFCHYLGCEAIFALNVMNIMKRL